MYPYLFVVSAARANRKHRTSIPISVVVLLTASTTITSAMLSAEGHSSFESDAYFALLHRYYLSLLFFQHPFSALLPLDACSSAMANLLSVPD